MVNPILKILNSKLQNIKILKHFSKRLQTKLAKRYIFTEKVKNTVPRVYVISDPNGKEIGKTFYKQELQKINVKDIKVIQKKVIDCIKNGKLLIY